MSTRFCTYTQNHSAAEVPPYVAAASPKALAAQATPISMREHSTTMVNRATIGPKTASMDPWKEFCNPTNATSVNTKTSQGDFLRATRGNVVSASAMKDDVAGNDGLDAEHAAQSLVGKDEACRDHQLHGTESKGGKRHRDVDRPIARAHFPIMYKHAVHAPIMRKPRTTRHTPCGVSEQNQRQNQGARRAKP